MMGNGREPYAHLLFFALLPPRVKSNSSGIKRFRTLSQKQGGVGVLFPNWGCTTRRNHVPAASFLSGGTGPRLRHTRSCFRHSRFYFQLETFNFQLPTQVTASFSPSA